MPGPVPKRSEERRRRNKEGGPVLKVNLAEIGASEVEVPAPDDTWHHVAYQLYMSLTQSGQSIFFEPSDWATAYALCETLSRSLDPVPMVVGGADGGKVEFHEVPMPGATLNAVLKGLASLMATEGDRRRLKMELERAAASQAKTGGGEVVPISQRRQERFRRPS